MPSLFMYGLVGILVILGTYALIGNKKDAASFLMVLGGIGLIILIVMSFSSFHHEVLNWFDQYPFFRSLFETK